MWEGAQRRRAALMLGGGLLLLATLVAWLAIGAIAGVFRALAERQPTLEVSGATFAMPVLAAVLSGWSAWGFAARGAPPPKRLEQWLVRGSLAALALMVAVPLATSAWADGTVPERGYRRCPDGTGRGRFQTTVWVLAMSPCPRKSG